VKTVLAGKGLAVESVRAAVPKGGLADAVSIDRTLETARMAMMLAREMGVGTVALHVGMLADGGKSGAEAQGHGDGGMPEATIVSALRELAQQADAAGLTLAVSSNGGTEALARILKQVDFDRAKINLDGARLIGAGEDVLQTAEWMAGTVGQLTVSDAIRAGRGVRAALLGDGQLPLRELVALLREQGFAGPWVVDVRGLPDGPAAAQHAADVLAG
jgi:sugar phosphate isomerase/epimerase